MRAPVVPHPCQDLVLSVLHPCDTWIVFLILALKIFCIFMQCMEGGMHLPWCACGDWRTYRSLFFLPPHGCGDPPTTHGIQVVRLGTKYLHPLNHLANLHCRFNFYFLPPNDHLFFFSCMSRVLYPGKKYSVRHKLPVFSPVVMQSRRTFSFGALGCLFKFMVHFEFIVVIFCLFVCKMT